MDQSLENNRNSSKRKMDKRETNYILYSQSHSLRLKAMQNKHMLPHVLKAGAVGWGDLPDFPQGGVEMAPPRRRPFSK